MTDLSVVIVTLADNLADIESLQTLKNRASDDVEFIVRTDAGISHARNRGIEQANSDNIVFIDDDAIPAPGYLDAARAALEEYPIVAGRVVHPGNGPISSLATHYPDFDSGGVIDHVVGCNMAFRREVFETVGYFDPALQWGHDETELVDRAREEFEVRYCPDMAVRHPYATSARDYVKKQWRFGPADVYYGRKSDSADEHNGGVLRTLLGPSQFIAPSVRGTLIKSVGRVVRNASIATALGRDIVGASGGGAAAEGQEVRRA